MVKSAEVNDLEVLANLAALLWQNHSIEDLFHEFSGIMSNGESRFFLKYEKNIPVGFAQCQLRHDYVEGTSTTPVGYLGSFCFHKAMNFKEANRIICFTKRL